MLLVALISPEVPDPAVPTPKLSALKSFDTVKSSAMVMSLFPSIVMTGSEPTVVPVPIIKSFAESSKAT